MLVLTDNNSWCSTTTPPPQLATVRLHLVTHTKKFFGYRRMDSMTDILLDLSLPTVNTILHNSRVLFAVHCINSNNDIVTLLNSAGV